MKIQSIQNLLEGIADLKSSADRAISAITLDSRHIKPGTLFLATEGEVLDGRNFIPEALAKGAYAIAYEAYEGSDPWFDFSKDIPLIPVKQLKKKVGVIASRFYQNPSEQISVIGVTGTNGKTSCTHFAAQALNQLQKKCAVIGTIGNGFLPHLEQSQLTTPDPISLQKNIFDLKRAGAEALAMEVSSHSLVQHRVSGVKFKIAVFTHLTRDHLDYHGDMESYGRAKELLFQTPDLEYGVVNLDDELGQRIIEKYHSHFNIITYSALGKSHATLPGIQAEKIIQTPHGFSVNVNTPWGKGEFATELLGHFNISNLLAVLGVLGLLKNPLDKILPALSVLHTVPGRMQGFGGGTQPLVVVDYSHTPDALEKGLKALRGHCSGRLICVFGCGGDRDRGKRPEMAAIAESLSDEIIITNDNPRTEDPWQILADIQKGLTQNIKAKVILDRSKAIEYAIQHASAGDIVLVAGKGHEDYQIIGQNKLKFSDAEEVQKQLNQRKV